MTATRRWFRFSLRTLFVVVTLIAVGCGVVQWIKLREAEFMRRSAEHFDNMAENGFIYSMSPEYFEYHQAQYDKYEHAAQYPWLPVASDPPEPEPSPEVVARGWE